MRPISQLVNVVTLLGVILVLIGLASGVYPTYANTAEPQAASITFTNPTALQTSIAEGDDFATRVLGNPWDMNERRDIGYEIGFTNVGVANGIWSGVFSGVDQSSGGATAGYFFPLFPGFSTPLPAGLSQELTWNKIGAQDRYAIPTAKYTHLSFRIYTSQRSQYYVHWTNAKPVTWPDGSQRFGSNDGCYSATQLIPWNPGWHTYSFDLPQPNGDAGVRAGNWQDSPLVRGLRIDPSAIAPAGTEIRVDWVRLSDPASAPTIAIPWSVGEATAEDKVDLYIADDANGTNASPLVRGIPASAGVYNLQTSILAPGRYYLQLRLMDGRAPSLGCATTKAVSEWTGPLTVVSTPVVSFAKPSMTSGADYATTELGNPWDMNDAGDIITPGPPYPQTIANGSFSNGIFSGQAILIPGQPHSDSQVWLNVVSDRPIDTARYRYLTIRYKVDTPAGRDINWLIANGWGGRIIWWNKGIDIDGSESKFGTYYEGWRTYSIDLAKAFPPLPISNPTQADNILTPREQSSFPAQQGWAQLGSVQHLRFDPLETTPVAAGTGAEMFAIDWVKLTAIDQAKRGAPYRIRVTLDRAPQLLQSLTFYYTTDLSQPTQNQAAPYTSMPATGPVSVFMPLVLQNQAEALANETSFLWDTSAVGSGLYYICAIANDGLSTATYCSDTPVEVAQ
jgi:hypothetical protein